MLNRIMEFRQDGDVINDVSLNNALALYSLFDATAVEKSKITLDPENCIYMTVDRENKKYILRFRHDGKIDFLIMEKKA